MTYSMFTPFAQNAFVGKSNGYADLSRTLGLGLEYGNAARKDALQLQADVLKGNAQQYALNTQGTSQLLGRMGQANQMYTSANEQLEQRAAFMMNQCIAGGGDPAQCRAQYDAMVGRTPQQTTTTAQMTPDPAYRPFNINSLLGS